MKNNLNIIMVLSLFLSISLASCSQRLKFLNSAVVPAAEGMVKINKDSNGNYAINIKVTHLAEPSRLQPKREVYVVWIVTEKNGNKNIGQLKSSSGFFSSVLEGELNTVSSFKPESVFITAEDNANIQFPGSIVILTTKGPN